MRLAAINAWLERREPLTSCSVTTRNHQRFLPAQAVRLTTQVEHLAVMQQPIQNRHHQRRIASHHFAPTGQTLVRGYHRRALLVAPADEFIERRTELWI